MAAARGAEGAPVRYDAAGRKGGPATKPSDRPGGVPWPVHLAPLLSMLRREATSFDFFQAVRILERLRPDREPVGLFSDPATEVVRFGVPASISFPPAEIATLDVPDDGPAKMRVNFFGLTGPQGVLPYHYTLLIAERERVRDNAIGEFFDIFHHRIISLFYRAWQKNHVSVNYEKQSDDRLSDHLLDLLGQGVELEGRGLSPLQRTLMFYVGLLGPQARGAAALEQLLEDIFDVHVEVDQFVGAWYSLPVADQCAVGEELGYSTQLGLGVVAGDEVWDQQTRVRIRLGPLDSMQYADFLPTGSAHALLRWLVRFFSRDAFDFEAQLVLDRDAVSGCVIGEIGAEPQPLGWSTWIRTTKAFSRDPGETILRL
jgi:type VI secretion system protein ImpH